MKKSFPSAWAVPAALVLLFWVSRIIVAVSRPPFQDEFVYLRWGLEVWRGDMWISLREVFNKPLLPWLLALLVGPFPKAVTSARGGMMLLGTGALLGYLRWGRENLPSSARWLPAVLYLLLPLSLFFNGRILYDPLAEFLAVWLVAVCYPLRRRTLTGREMAAAVFLMSALLLTRTSGLFFIPLPLLLALPRREEKAFAQGILIPLIGGAAAAGVLAIAIPAVGWNQAIFFGPRSTYLSASVAGPGFFSRLAVLSEAGLFLIAPALLIPLVSLPLFTRPRKESSPPLFPLLIPAAAMALVHIEASFFYPRYLMLFLPLLIPAASAAVSRWVLRPRWRRWLIGIWIVGLGMTLVQDGRLMTGRWGNRMPVLMEIQYQDGWPAGAGMEAVYKTIEEYAEAGPVTVLVPAFVGLPADALFIRFKDDSRIRFGRYRYPEAGAGLDLPPMSSETPVLLVGSAAFADPGELAARNPGWDIVIQTTKNRGGKGFFLLAGSDSRKATES